MLGGSGRFSFGSADLLREVLGVEPGSVTPFALDQRQGAPGAPRCSMPTMMEHDVLNYHPLVNTMTTSIARDDLAPVRRNRPGIRPLIRPVSRPAGGLTLPIAFAIVVAI